MKSHDAIKVGITYWTQFEFFLRKRLSGVLVLRTTFMEHDMLAPSPALSGIKCVKDPLSFVRRRLADSQNNYMPSFAFQDYWTPRKEMCATKYKTDHILEHPMSYQLRSQVTVLPDRQRTKSAQQYLLGDDDVNFQYCNNAVFEKHSCNTNCLISRVSICIWLFHYRRLRASAARLQSFPKKERLKISWQQRCHPWSQLRFSRQP